MPATVDRSRRAPQRREPALDNTPPLLKLNMTSRQQRKLWRHVEAIENFWETLAEIEPGAGSTSGGDGARPTVGSHLSDQASRRRPDRPRKSRRSGG